MKTLLAIVVTLMMCASEACDVPVQDPTPSPGPPGSSVHYGR